MPILEFYGLFKQPNTNKRGSFTWNERSLQLLHYLNNKEIPDLVTVSFHDSLYNHKPQASNDVRHFKEEPSLLTKHLQNW